MRKSSAPSQRRNFISPLLGGTANTNLNKTSECSIDKYKFINKFSYNIEKENMNKQEIIQSSGNNLQKVHLPSNSEVNESSNTKRRFNVVYGKQSKKKHKTWEGDGIIEVVGKSITLKDSDDKVLGHSTCKKSEELSEGIRIFVGSKEVEILDLITENIAVKKRSIPEENNLSEEIQNPTIKKTKIEQHNPQDLQAKNSKPISNPISLRQSTNQIKNNSQLSSNVDPLIMPRPSEEHQWLCNINHLPVTDVQVDYSLTKVLRQHQREGVTFLYKCVTGLRSTDHTGVILADEMGLGKTLQCVTLIWTLLNHGFYGGKPIVKRVLIVVPSSLVKNWYNEFIRWIGSYRIKIFAVDKNNKIQNYSKSPFVPVVIISYEMFVKNYNIIKEIDFDMIVCDEGHRLKNSNIQTTALLNQLPCMKRVLLTGTPLQNDLQEFYALVNFVNPGILGTIQEFKNNYEKIIEASREPDASEEVVAKGEEQSKELMKITNNFILRRTQSVIGSYLPPKHEHVIFCSMSPIQRKLYSKLTDYCIQKCENLLAESESNIDHLSSITCLKKISNHPSLVANNDFFHPSLLSEVQNVIGASNGFITSSVKLIILDSLLSHLEKSKEKIVLVSNFTQTLDVLEKFCRQKNRSFARFDGSTPIAQRNSIVSNFNARQSNIDVLLLSSKAGGVGLNLIGASRLVLFDSDWNPATDLQAMSRIWRDGQRRNVFIYRLLTSGTVEEKIFQRQLKKAGLSESVVDPLAVSAVKLSKEELKDLFEYRECSNFCTTHEALNCKCDGNGSVPGIPQESNLDEDYFNNDSDFSDFDLSLDLFDGSCKPKKSDKTKCLPDLSKDVESSASNSNNKICFDEEISKADSSIINTGLDDTTDDLEERRDCEISFSCKKEEVKPKALRMNQLFQWEHHASPISSDVLEEIGLNSETACHINFLFRNKSI